MAYVCCVASCDEIATIMVPIEISQSDPSAPSTGIGPLDLPRGSYCRADPPRPSCFVGDCAAGAVVVMEHTDASLLPCCETHLNDLSWVVPEHARLRF